MGFLNSLIVRIKGDNADLKKTLADSNKTVSSFGSSISKLGGMIAAAFSVGAIVNFGKEAIRLAAQTEGVGRAFSALNDPALLNNLRIATRGTVTDLVLMQKAVQAKNFKIPLEQLATYFEFATKRAIQTGESVDYLVDSIITGIGRKSVLVMDNLGISAVELQQEVERVGDFGAAAGEIIRRELTSMGDVADTTAIKFAQLATTWQNFKAETGKRVAESPVFQSTLKWVGDVTRLWKTGMPLTMAITQMTFNRKNAVEAVAEYEKEVTEELNKQAALIPKVTRGTPRVESPVMSAPAAPIQSGVTAPAMSGELVDMNIFNPESMDAFTIQAVAEVQAMQDIITSAISGAADVIADGFGQLFEGIGAGNLDGVFNNILSGMAEFIISLGKMMIQYGIMLKMIGLAGKLGPAAAPALIGAGLAAVAIGSLIKGAVSKGPSLTGGGSYGGGGGGGYRGGLTPIGMQTITVEGVLKGSDILISNRRTAIKQGGQT
jgi:hypothetical protein